MNNMNKLKEIIKIADIHADRIKMAMNDLSATFPLNEYKAQNLSKEEILIIELLTSRFAKLQDLMGRKIIDEFLLHILHC